MTSPSEFERLIQEVSSGSEDAIWKLVETYTPFIIRSVRSTLPSRLRPRLDSQDIAQAIWASILLGECDLERLKSPQQLIAFLMKTAKNKVTTQTRRYFSLKRDVSKEVRTDQDAVPTRYSVHSIFSREPSPSQLIATRERWEQLVSNSTERDRRILRMRLDRRSYDEISAEVQVSHMTARRVIERLVEGLCQ
jgi:RNA polymerase sigma factor (sigma-70 family)